MAGRNGVEERLITSLRGDFSHGVFKCYRVDATRKHKKSQHKFILKRIGYC